MIDRTDQDREEFYQKILRQQAARRGVSVEKYRDIRKEEGIVYAMEQLGITIKSINHQSRLTILIAFLIYEILARGTE